MADAKRRGWSGQSSRSRSTRRGGGGGRNTREVDFDAASSVAWTDVTVDAYSVRDAFGISGRMRPGTSGGASTNGPGGRAKKGKCIVM